MSAEDQLSLSQIIEAAKGGDGQALAKLSGIAAGGQDGDYAIARAAILAIDASVWPPVNDNLGWPKDVKSGKRTPRLGDVLLTDQL